MAAIKIDGNLKLAIDLAFPIGGHRPQAVEAFIDLVRAMDKEAKG